MSRLIVIKNAKSYLTNAKNDYILAKIGKKHYKEFYKGEEDVI